MTIHDANNIRYYYKQYIRVHNGLTCVYSMNVWSTMCLISLSCMATEMFICK
jgi:hypothetical protein